MPRNEAHPPNSCRADHYRCRLPHIQPHTDSGPCVEAEDVEMFVWVGYLASWLEHMNLVTDQGNCACLVRMGSV